MILNLSHAEWLRKRIKRTNITSDHNNSQRENNTSGCTIPKLPIRLPLYTILACLPDRNSGSFSKHKRHKYTEQQQVVYYQVEEHVFFLMSFPSLSHAPKKIENREPQTYIRKLYIVSCIITNWNKGSPHNFHNSVHQAMNQLQTRHPHFIRFYQSKWNKQISE